ELTPIPVSTYDSTISILQPYSPPAPQNITPTYNTNFLMDRLAYRKFGTHQALVGNFTVGIGTSHRAAVRWFELRKGNDWQGCAAGSHGAGWEKCQEGTLGVNGTLNRWLGSIAMDGWGN